MATPLEKSPEALSTSPVAPLVKLTAPVSGELAVSVTLLVEALKFVIVFPEASLAVRVLVPVKATPSVWGLAAAKVKLAREPGLIVTLFEVPVLPEAEVPLKVPVLALPVYVMPRVVKLACPPEKSPEVLSTFPAPWRPETVPVSGETAVIDTLLDAALKPVIVLLPTSWAVRVLVPVKATPLVWGLVKDRAKWSRAPTLIVTLPEVPVLLPTVEVAVKVPVVALPV